MTSNFNWSFNFDEFEYQGYTSNDHSWIHHYRTNAHRPVVILSYVAPIKTTHIFIKVQESSYSKSKELLEKEGILHPYGGEIDGRDVRRFCERHRRDFRISVMPGTGNYRIFLITWSPKGHAKDPVRGGDILEQYIEELMKSTLQTERRTRPLRLIGTTAGGFVRSHYTS